MPRFLVHCICDHDHMLVCLVTAVTWAMGDYHMTDSGNERLTKKVYHGCGGFKGMKLIKEIKGCKWVVKNYVKLVHIVKHMSNFNVNGKEVLLFGLGFLISSV